MEEYLAQVAKTGNALFVQNEIESVELSEASEENSQSVEGAIADKEAEKVSITKVSDEFRCEICDFTTNRRKGLHIHISKKHAKIEQLDGIHARKNILRPKLACKYVTQKFLFLT